MLMVLQMIDVVPVEFADFVSGVYNLFSDSFKLLVDVVNFVVNCAGVW